MLMVITTIAVALITILASCINAYMQRRLMRQIELFRVNPAMGLTPPPPAALSFIKREWLFIVIEVIVVACVIYTIIWRQSANSTPLLIGAIVLLLSVLYQDWCAIRHLNILRGVLSVIEQHVDVTKRLEEQIHRKSNATDVTP